MYMESYNKTDLYQIRIYIFYNPKHVMKNFLVLMD